MASFKSRIRRQICQGFLSIHSAGSYKQPVYQHDQCERSLHMHLFTMEKRDITLLLVFTIAFNAFCIMVASFGPKSHVLDAVVLGKSMTNLRGNQREVEREYYQLPDEFASDPLPDQDQTVEMRMMTKPLNALNRPINFLLQAEFDLLIESNRTVDTIQNFSQDAQAKTIGNYQLEWLMRAHDDDDSSGAQRSDCGYNNDSCKRGTKDRQVLDKDVNQRFAESLNVMFCCTKSTLKADIKLEPQPLDISRQNLFRCRAPDLSFSYKISDFKRRRYQLSINVNDFNFLSTQDRKTSSNSSDERTIDLKPVAANSIHLAITLSYTNSSFTYLTIFIHMLFLIISLCIGCCFILCLIKYPLHLWSLEQKLTSLLFVLLIAANRPFYTLELLGGIYQPAQRRPVFTGQNLGEEQSTLPPGKTSYSSPTKIASNRNHYDLLDSVLDLTFVCGLLLSWVCFAHSLRQMSRPFWRFYLPKLALVGAIWLMALTALFIADASQFKWCPVEISPDQTKLDAAFYVALIAYIACLVYHFVCTAIELKPMSYFIIRYRTQATLCAMVLIDYAAIVLLRPPSHRLQPPAHQFDQPPHLDPNTSNPMASILMRQTASQQSSYGSTYRKPSGAPSSYSADLIEFVSRWNVDASDQTQSSILDLLPQKHALDSACSFLCYVMVNNLYVLICAYLYWPVLHSAPIPCKLLPSANHDSEREDLRATMIDS